MSYCGDESAIQGINWRVAEVLELGEEDGTGSGEEKTICQPTKHWKLSLDNSVEK